MRVSWRAYLSVAIIIAWIALMVYTTVAPADLRDTDEWRAAHMCIYFMAGPVACAVQVLVHTVKEKERDE